VTRRAAVLAVDGGGSKVDAALVARDGSLLGAARWNGSTYHGMFDWHSKTPSAHVMQGVGHAVEAACADAGIDGNGTPVADVAIFCVAGADLPADDRRILRGVRVRGWAKDNVVRNDTFAVMRAGADRGWGIAVVCGAGLNCSGVGPDGRIVRFASLGDISGDEVSGGSWLGVEALGASIRAVEGRGPRTELERLVPRYLGLRSARAVMEAIHLGSMGQDRLIELAPLVFQAARDGDDVAAGMIQRLIDEIVLWATVAIRRLRVATREVDVVLGGGVVQHQASALVPGIAEGIRRAAPLAEIHQLSTPPVAGAALLGLDKLSAPRRARTRVRETLTHERLRAQTLPRRKET
jgi:N-acetylglucosamine kinase-like BadF-type ATPase